MFRDRGLNTFQSKDNGWMEFHYCAKKGSNDIIKFLADRGTDIHLKTIDEKNCLHIAALYGHLSLCEALIDEQNFDVNMLDNCGLTALHYSAENGKYQLVKFFADKVNDFYMKTKYGRNCLHIAALNGNLNLYKALIDKHNFDVHTADKHGFTALHCSAQNGSYELVKFFLDKGTDILSKTKSGMNCLHIAETYSHLNFCKTLISTHKFDVDINESVALTILDWCTKCHCKRVDIFSALNDSYELVKFMVDKATDVPFTIKHGKNCVQLQHMLDI